MSMPEWLKIAVFYEIYPQSFYDSNGDGIGDLQGIIAKLDYVKSLGVNAIWLNPCFDSPFQDAGYDIRDYYKIAPRYGTNDDMKQLLDTAHKKGLKVVLDLVAGHTSIEHPWFKESCKSMPNKYSNYYIWTNDWQDDVGKYRFINGYGERNGFFMINFFYCQPALNYGFCHPDSSYPWQQPMDHPDVKRVREELKNVMKFWLDMGCDGFRVDMASSLVRGDNAKEGLSKLWHEYRSWLEQNYPQAILISEWSFPPEAINVGFHIDFMVHFRQNGYTGLFRAEAERIGNGSKEIKHSFFDRSGLGDASIFFNDLIENLKKTSGKGYVAIPTGNHDIGRIRGKRSIDELRTIYVFLMLLPGIPFIYYGDEIGMDNVYGLGNKEGSYNRSAARTPMQWAQGKKGGFSNANPENFYLPLDPSPARPDVETEEKDQDSLLNFTRKLISMRRNNAALCSDGGFRAIYVKENQTPVIYERFTETDSWIIGVNPFAIEAVAQFDLPNSGVYSFVENSDGTTFKFANGSAKLTLPAGGYAVLRRQ